MTMESTEIQLCQAMAMSLHLAPEIDVAVKSIGGKALQAETLQNPKDKEAVDIESTPDIVFNPTIGIQRYIKVRETLEFIISRSCPKLPKSILEVGCAKFRLHPYLKRLHESVQKLVYMDIDEAALEQAHKEVLNPLAVEYLTKRPSALVVEAYAGDITKCDQKILTMDPKLFCVVAIEVIEHLDPEVLEGFEKTVFGVLSPTTVILTTPNAEFNVVFNLPSGHVRHWDHKFEWSRDQFHAWCSKICEEYPSYTYSALGIGEGPPGTEAYGCVSQMAVFIKIDNAPHSPNISLAGIVAENSYKLITRIEYPYERLTVEEKILRAFECYVTMHVLNPSSLDEYAEDGLTEIVLNLDRILSIYEMPKAEKGKILDVLNQAGKALRFNAVSSEYEVVLELPEQGSRWPPSDFEDVDKDSGTEESNPIPNDLEVLSEMDEELW